MSTRTKKEEAAEAVKQAADTLRTVIQQAEQLGLTVQVLPPMPHALAPEAQRLRVDIWERLTY